MFPLTGRIIYALPPIFSLFEKDCSQQESNNSSFMLTVNLRERLQPTASAFLLMSELHIPGFCKKGSQSRPLIPVAALGRLLLSIDAFKIWTHYNFVLCNLQYTFSRRNYAILTSFLEKVIPRSMKDVCVDKAQKPSCHVDEKKDDIEDETYNTEDLSELILDVPGTECSCLGCK